MTFKYSFLTVLSGSAMATGAVLALAGQAQAITFTGDTAGSWGLPAIPSTSTVLSNENGGTNNRLTWGVPIIGSFSNFVQFDGLGFAAEVDRLFAIGNLSYRNGSTTDTFDGDFPLGVDITFVSPFATDETFSYTFNILNTTNTDDPIASADRLRFSAAGLTEDTFTFDGVEYTINLVGFSTDGGTSLVSEFNSPEGSTAQATLFAQITAAPLPPTPENIPEPGMLAGLALCGLYAASRRR
ncbi:MAG: hypothetical protein HC925_02735 [Coleofasciculaceae cyanobacterium SM2_3_26]|nr:hypothetical protein [Coleofasciculaceae cyanobacterium SM2_3_26]